MTGQEIRARRYQSPALLWLMEVITVLVSAHFHTMCVRVAQGRPGRLAVLSSCAASFRLLLRLLLLPLPHLLLLPMLHLLLHLVQRMD